mgnify:FL=1
MSAPMILAESEVERIIRLSRNAEFARAYLEKGIRVPTFPEILAEYSGVTDASALREKLCTRLQGMIGEPNAASIRRKVSVWFTGKTAPENRGQLVRIVFALDMSDEQAQNFLACAGGGCLHQRNPIELAYLYALRSRLGYNEACHLIERIRHIAIGGQGKTEVLENEFTKIRGEDEFVDFIRQQRMNLGELHNTAYELFSGVHGGAHQAAGQLPAPAGARIQRAQNCADVLEAPRGQQQCAWQNPARPLAG